MIPWGFLVWRGAAEECRRRKAAARAYYELADAAEEAQRDLAALLTAVKAAVPPVTVSFSVDTSPLDKLMDALRKAATTGER